MTTGVEVSGDGGSIWYETPYEELSQKYYHAWRLWSIDLPVDAEGWLELVVRYVHYLSTLPAHPIHPSALIELDAGTIL